MTDGPFAETREQLGGFFLIDAANLDEAIDIAGRIPAGGRAPSKSVPSRNCRACPRSVERSGESNLTNRKDIRR